MHSSELLKWQMEMGADEAFAEAPVDHTAAQTVEQPKVAAMPAPAAATPSAPVIKRTAPMGASQAEAQARSLADACHTLAELKEAVSNFDSCSIKKTATNTVFCDGNPDSDIMFIGEAPGAQEDIQGIPFCGDSGELLDTMIGHIGLDRTNIYISNTIFWRPPGNRRPTPEELTMCKPFVERHIALMEPKLLVLVGGTATATVLDTKTGITKLRGEFFTYKNQYIKEEIPVAALFHPAYLMRQPAQKRLAWQDLLAIRTFMREKGVNAR